MLVFGLTLQIVRDDLPLRVLFSGFVRGNHLSGADCDVSFAKVSDRVQGTKDETSPDAFDSWSDTLATAWYQLTTTRAAL